MILRWALLLCILTGWGANATLHAHTLTDTLRLDSLTHASAPLIKAREGDLLPPTAAKDSTLGQWEDLQRQGTKALRHLQQRFVPSPHRALWLALMIPGAGQIYNRKYWKLPIIYGGFLGCTYAFLWNQQMYRDYSQAYLDIMDNDPTTHSYTEILPPGYSIQGREDRFKTIFKNKKDYYRRYRDMSAFVFIGVYLLSVVDAYVDAELSVFDISKDLSLQVKPAIITNTALTSHTASAWGVGCSLNF